MMKRILLAAPMSLALIVAPLSAQDEDALEAEYSEEEAESDEPMQADMMAGMGAIFGELFKVEPLTEDQTARLPAAERVAGQILPDGAMAEVINGMVSDFMDPLMSMAPSPAQSTVTSGLGVSRFELEDMGEEQIAELATILDPAWEVRREREKNALPKVLSEVATVMEPTVRAAMAEIFAVNFEAPELAELEAFFSTAVGAKYARESYTMATDPRLLSAAFQSAPQIMGKVGDMKKVMEDATADLPEKRSFVDLSPAEKARVAELSGFTVEELESGEIYTDEEAAEEAYEEAAE